MNFDTRNGKVSIEVGVDEVLSGLVEHFHEFPRDDLYFNHNDRIYILRVVEDWEPYSPDEVQSRLNEITDLAAELLRTTGDPMASRIIRICENLKDCWKLEKFIEERKGVKEWE